MSRLNEAVEALSRGVEPKRSGLVDVAGRLECMRNDYGRKEVWRFGVRLSVQTTLPDHLGINELEGVRRDIVQQVQQYAFGEFRDPLMALRKRAYEVGDAVMIDGVNEVLNKMFKE